MFARTIVSLSLLSVLSLAAAFSFSGCSDAPSDGECKKLLDHLIEIEMAASGSGGLSSELQADVAAVKKRVIGDLEKDFLKSCQKSLPQSQVTCGLRAKNPTELTACDEG